MSCLGTNKRASSIYFFLIDVKNKFILFMEYFIWLTHFFHSWCIESCKHHILYFWWDLRSIIWDTRLPQLKASRHSLIREVMTLARVDWWRHFNFLLGAAVVEEHNKRRFFHSLPNIPEFSLNYNFNEELLKIWQTGHK